LRQRYRKTHFGSIEHIVGQAGFKRFFEQPFALLPLDLELAGQGGQPLNQHMIHEGFPHLKRVGHAGTIDLGVDVADQPGLVVEILDECQRVVGVGPGGVLHEHVLRAVTRQCALEVAGEEPVALIGTQHRHAVHVGLNRVAGQGLKGGFGAEHAWRPIGFGVDPRECLKQGLAQTKGQGVAGLFFHEVQTVTSVTAKGFIAAIARQRHRDVFACQLADPVGGYGGAVGVGFVIKPGQPVDQVKVIALDHLEVVVGVVAVCNLLGKGRFVEFGHVKADGACAHRHG